MKISRKILSLLDIFKWYIFFILKYYQPFLKLTKQIFHHTLDLINASWYIWKPVFNLEINFNEE